MVQAPGTAAPEGIPQDHSQWFSPLGSSASRFMQEISPSIPASSASAPPLPDTPKEAHPRPAASGSQTSIPPGSSSRCSSSQGSVGGGSAGFPSQATQNPVSNMPGQAPAALCSTPASAAEASSTGGAKSSTLSSWVAFGNAAQASIFGVSQTGQDIQAAHTAPSLGASQTSQDVQAARKVPSYGGAHAFQSAQEPQKVPAQHRELSAQESPRTTQLAQAVRQRSGVCAPASTGTSAASAVQQVPREAGLGLMAFPEPKAQDRARLPVSTSNASEPAVPDLLRWSAAGSLQGPQSTSATKQEAEPGRDKLGSSSLSMQAPTGEANGVACGRQLFSPAAKPEHTKDSDASLQPTFSASQGPNAGTLPTSAAHRELESVKAQVGH